MAENGMTEKKGADWKETPTTAADVSDTSSNDDSEDDLGRGRSCFESCCVDENAGLARDNYWDNYKGLSQLFVCSVHLSAVGVSVAAYNSTDWLDSVPGRITTTFNNYLMYFMMPSFCFITGLLSTSSPGPKQLNNQIRYTVTFVIQHGFLAAISVGSTNAAMTTLWKKEHPDVNATNSELLDSGDEPLEPPGLFPVPYYQMLGLDWYLFCVIIWRCALPALARLSRPLTVSVLFAFTALWTDAFISTYSLAPFTFLPFFVCGFLAKERQGALLSWRKMLSAKVGFLGLSVLLLVLSNLTWPDDRLASGLLCIYGSQVAYSAEDLIRRGYNVTADSGGMLMEQLIEPNTFCQSLPGMGCVAAFYVMAFILVFCFMGVVPEEEVTLLTRCGRNSIYIYLTQMWFAILPVYSLAGMLPQNDIYLGPWLGLVLAFATPLFFWALLGQQWVKCVCGPCIEPEVEKCGLAV
eukprot:TRINITY_DN28970_c0_g1_i4.p1 TRINITY_DN28970_c0_g1~~TRINITY_DN28970_c0_g1_i4.p1  ORF type:complete len:466 (+),score=44.27 TRINITY_DN28970_c0_g1_i4:68-1465(+)